MALWGRKSTQSPNFVGKRAVDCNTGTTIKQTFSAEIEAGTQGNQSKETSRVGNEGDGRDNEYV